MDKKIIINSVESVSFLGIDYTLDSDTFGWYWFHRFLGNAFECLAMGENAKYKFAESVTGDKSNTGDWPYSKSREKAIKVMFALIDKAIEMGLVDEIKIKGSALPFFFAGEHLLNFVKENPTVDDGYWVYKTKHHPLDLERTPITHGVLLPQVSRKFDYGPADFKKIADEMRLDGFNDFYTKYLITPSFSHLAVANPSLIGVDNPNTEETLNIKPRKKKIAKIDYSF